MSRPQQFLEDAIAAAKRAVQFDTDQQYEPATYFYTIAAKLLVKAADISEAEKATALRKKSQEYSQRAAVLEQLKDAEYSTQAEDEHKKRLKRLHFLLQQGLDADNAGLKDTAVDLYAQAIEYVTHYPEFMHGELREIVIQALERAEALKGIKRVSNEATSSAPENVSKSNFKPLQFVPKAAPTLQRSSSIQLKVTGGKDGYTEEEKRVLFHTSRINKNEYVPFMSIDLKEKFQYAISFTDKDGVLALSPKQKREFAGWVRPEDICTDPCIVVGDHPDYYSIKQTIVSDCSFVASLAVSAQYERRFVKKIITAKIFPRTKDKRPIYNPFGKYMVKLILNGVARKVIIDDTLPISKHGRLLCSYSSNRNEFWVSLLEKAYMKVMGGYDFPGSNSNIDLHALTGWIPERIAIRSKEQDFNKDALFSTLETRLSKGDVLITTATGELSEAEAERTGLVATHAYAVLDVRNVNGARLLKLKNPWSHLRWKGNYSELDTRHWTPELQRLLNYDPNSASQFDNGVFWIDYDSICAFFEVFYLNWNPELFQYTYCTHQAWHACTGPVKDLYNIGNNPQFSLEVGLETKGAIWVLLTRHITEIDDFRENKEYITLLVYNTNGKRVYYPNDPSPYIDGVRINSPHYLCKIILNPTSSKKYTLVVSQYEKTQTIFYTIRAYSTCPFTLSKIEDPYVHTKEVTGEWKGVTAGGCGNHQSTYKNNPMYRVEIEGVRSDNEILIELKGPKQYQIGFDVTIASVNDTTVTAPFKTTTSGPFRSGFVVLELNNIPCGVLNIVPSTFLPGQEGPFILTVKSRLPLQISRER
ncbi:calpain-7 [Agrilus planipennis]|uniref:Calpain-7 n=1 Tax=Agrilus planipennis TaxID=224129 RepID=A0A1W4WZ80_AGRPL|nr:calpain-7 [Agrilus planipennis]